MNFLLFFWNLYKILKNLERMMILIANVFSKLQWANHKVRKTSKKSCFWTLFDREHGKGSQKLLKYSRKYFHQIL